MIGRTLTDARRQHRGRSSGRRRQLLLVEAQPCARSQVLDRTLKLGTTDFNIVGVAPPEFFGTKVGESPDIWIPHVHGASRSRLTGKGAYQGQLHRIALHHGPAQARRQHGAGHHQCQSALSADPAPAFRGYLSQNESQRLWKKRMSRSRPWQPASLDCAESSPSR